MTEKYYAKSAEGDPYEITELLPPKFHDIFVSEKDIREHIHAQLEHRRREGLPEGGTMSIAPVYISYNKERYQELVKTLSGIVRGATWPDDQLSFTLNPAGSNIIVVINAN